MSTTARARARAGMVTCAQAFSTANPTLCYAVHPVRPTKFTGDIPFCFIDVLREDGLHTAGIQQRVLEPSFVFIIRPLENEEQVALSDAIVDGFTEHLKDYAHIDSNLVWSRWRFEEDTEDNDDGVSYPSLRFTLTDLSEGTGRTS